MLVQTANAPWLYTLYKDPTDRLRRCHNLLTQIIGYSSSMHLSNEQAELFSFRLMTELVEPGSDIDIGRKALRKAIDAVCWHAGSILREAEKGGPEAKVAKELVEKEEDLFWAVENLQLFVKEYDDVAGEKDPEKQLAHWTEFWKESFFAIMRLNEALLAGEYTFLHCGQIKSNP